MIVYVDPLEASTIDYRRTLATAQFQLFLEEQRQTRMQVDRFQEQEIESKVHRKCSYDIVTGTHIATIQEPPQYSGKKRSQKHRIEIYAHAL